MKDEFNDQLWLGSLACVAIAVVGTAASLFVRALPAAQPNLQMRLSSFTVPRDTIALGIYG